MRSALAMLIASGLILCGCGPKPEPSSPETQATDTEPAPPTEEAKPAEPQEQKPAPAPSAATNKPKGYIETVVSQPARMKTKFNDLALKQSLEAYKAMNGEYPKTLDDLKSEGMAPPSPPAGKKYEYDPKTGTVWLVNK